MSLTLEPMRESDFAAYLECLIPEYAAAGSEATGMPPDEALGFARRQIRELLPDGRETTGHHFMNLTGPDGTTVGILWFAERPEETPPDLFLYDINVSEDHRRKGFGSAAIRALHERASDLGAGAVSLHVFETNVAAIRLYERLGYECTHRGQGGQQMTLRLQSAPTDREPQGPKSSSHA
jgi:ribosomal protein S18 acetylase RimI-like enzyme